MTGINRRGRANVIVAVLACGVMLSACGIEQTPETTASSSSSSTPSSSSNSNTSTSTDSDGARATTVVRNYEETTNEVRLDPSIPTGELGAYATGQSYRQRTHDIRQSRAQGKQYQGRVKIVEIEATKRSATSQQVVACTDLTAREITDKNGSEIEVPYERVERIYTVEKSSGASQDGKWRVTAERVKQTC